MKNTSPAIIIRSAIDDLEEILATVNLQMRKDKATSEVLLQVQHKAAKAIFKLSAELRNLNEQSA
jgi:hypothetical protein